MTILGINFSHDAAVCLLRNGKVIAAMEEEKISRVKQDFGWPVHAVNRLLEEHGITKKEIDVIAFGGMFYTGLNKNEIRYRFRKNKLYKYIEILHRAAHAGGLLPQGFSERIITIFEKEVIKAGFTRAEVRFYDHHLCHAASVWYAAPFECDLVFTADGHGDGVSLAFFGHTHNEGLSRLQAFGHEVSVGQFYSAITRLLGFRPNRHEGKITGLAAYGEPGPLLEKFRGLFRFENGDLSRFPFGESELHWNNYGLNKEQDLKTKINAYSETETGREYARNARILEAWLQQETAGHSKEDIAYACQKVTEEVMLQLLADAASKHNGAQPIRLGLAGGVFANVRVNQLLAEHPLVAQIFVQPAMGDSGLALGAAYLADIEQHGRAATGQYRFSDTYIGADYQEDLDAFLAKIDRHIYQVEDMGEAAPDRIAGLLQENLIIGFWHGKMEWGPRALGKRSMILNTFDRSVNDTLNKRLNRTEFMPFAPSVLDFMAKTYMPAYREEDVAADYMTVTYDVDKQYHEQLQAVVHVDGTARPQVVKRGNNSYYYDILEAFYRLSGCGAIVNTSFNVHEEPIVSTPESAFRALEDRRIDALVLERWLIRHKTT